MKDKSSAKKKVGAKATKKGKGVEVDSSAGAECPCGAERGPERGAERVNHGGEKSPAIYSECCGLHHLHRAAPTAEALMRSRYCAFVRADEAYLLATWHPQTRPKSVELDDRQRWLGLKIMQTSGGGIEDEEGTVEFVARYKIDGKGHRLAETSRFLKVCGVWLYHSG